MVLTVSSKAAGTRCLARLRGRTGAAIRCLACPAPASGRPMVTFGHRAERRSPRGRAGCAYAVAAPGAGAVQRPSPGAGTGSSAGVRQRRTGVSARSVTMSGKVPRSTAARAVCSMPAIRSAVSAGSATPISRTAARMGSDLPRVEFHEPLLTDGRQAGGSSGPRRAGARLRRFTDSAGRTGDAAVGSDPAPAITGDKAPKGHDERDLACRRAETKKAVGEMDEMARALRQRCPVRSRRSDGAGDRAMVPGREHGFTIKESG